MCDKTCNDCVEFLRNSEQCGHPMVYLNHTTNVHKTDKETKACGFFYPKQQPAMSE